MNKTYRNLETIENIEPQALWMLDEDTEKIVLVDDDQYVAVDWEENKEKFEAVSA